MTDLVSVSRRLHLATAGNADGGPLLLCLHGIGSSSASFAAQLDGRTGLSAVARVVAWDAPGYGQSPDPAPGTSLSELAEMVAELVRERGGRAVLFGMSWGGVLAARVALDHPEVVDGLVLGDSTPGSGTSAEKAAAMRARVPELLERGARAFAEGRAPRLLRAAASAEESSQAVALMASSIRPAGYAVAAESMATTDLRPELGRIDVPTLIFYGEGDRITGRQASEELARGIRGASLVAIPDAGHLANQENPAAVNETVTAFLRDLSRE